MEHESNGDTICNWCTRNGPQRLGKGTGCLGNQSRNRDLSNYGIIEIGQNTEKSPGNLKRLAVTQTPVTDHQLVLT